MIKDIVKERKCSKEWAWKIIKRYNFLELPGVVCKDPFQCDEETFKVIIDKMKERTKRGRGAPIGSQNARKKN